MRAVPRFACRPHPTRPFPADEVPMPWFDKEYFPSVPVASDEDVVEVHEVHLKATRLDYSKLKAQELIALQVIANIPDVKISYLAKQIRWKYRATSRMVSSLAKRGYLWRKSNAKLGLPNSYEVIGYGKNNPPKIWGRGVGTEDLGGRSHVPTEEDILGSKNSITQPKEATMRPQQSEEFDGTGDAPRKRFQKDRVDAVDSMLFEFSKLFQNRYKMAYVVVPKQSRKAGHSDYDLLANVMNGLGEEETRKRLQLFVAKDVPKWHKKSHNIWLFCETVNDVGQPDRVRTWGRNEVI